jgi:hypothetical protein
MGSDLQDSGQDTFANLVDWFLHSPIYDSGKYFSYYLPNRKGPIYPEITAYAISLSCALFERNQDERFLKRAEVCARYMMGISKNGAVPCFGDNLLYSFDTGIFVSAILDLYMLTNNAVYLEEADKSLRWLISLWDGKRFLAVDRQPESVEWHHVPSVHLVKLAIPLAKAWACFKIEEYKKIALQLLDTYKHLQKENGSFGVSEGSDVVVTHPHCYATEGFLYSYYAFGQAELLDVARKASNWLFQAQNPDGSLYRTYSGRRPTVHRKPEKLKVTDATAQATRIWKLLGVNPEAIAKSYSYLDGESKDGGLRLYKRVSLMDKLLPSRQIYSWPTFFYLHSIALPFGHLEYCKELF